MSDIAKAYVQVVPSAQGISGKLSGIFGAEGSSAGTSFGNSLISKVKTMIAAAGIGKAIGSSLTAGADLQQSLGGIETLFKDSAGIVIKNAEQAYKTAGMSANQYMEMVTGFSASLLQGLGGDTQKAAGVADMALTDMSDNANKMGTSMQSIQDAYQGFAKQNYTMLDNLKLGYGGTKTEMERLLADAQKLTGVKYDISNLADVYTAIHVIQEEMGITGTTALESAETFSGSLASMKAAFSDLLANLATGREIGPTLEAMSQTIFTFVQGNLLPMVGNILTELPTVLSSAFSMAIRGLNLVAENAEAIVQMGIDLVTGIGTAIITALPYLAEAALNIVLALGNALFTADWATIGSNAMTLLRSSIDVAAGSILGTDGNIVQAVMTAITTHLPSLLSKGVEIVSNVASGVLNNLPAVVTAAGELMTQFVSFIADNLPTVLEHGVQLVLSLVEGLISSIPNVISAITQVIAELLATVLSHLPDLLESGITLISELAVGLIQAIPEVVGAAADIIENILTSFRNIDWVSLGSNIIDGIVNGLFSGVGRIVEAAGAVAQNALDAARSWLGIASPSKVMRDQVGKFIPEGMAVGIEANTKPLKDAMGELSGIATDIPLSDLSVKTGTPAAYRAIHSGDITFHIYASEGQDPEEIADRVMEKIQHKIDQEEASVA